MSHGLCRRKKKEKKKVFLTYQPNFVFKGDLKLRYFFFWPNGSILVLHYILMHLNDRLTVEILPNLGLHWLPVLQIRRGNRDDLGILSNLS